MAAAVTNAFPQHRITNTDNVRTGNAMSAGRQKLGVPLAGAEAQAAIRISLGAPAVASANAAAVSQAILAGASAILNGALAAGSPAVVTFDFPRTVVGAWTTNSVVTVTGTDEYGQTMSEVSALAAVFTGKKAFKTITSITSSIAVTAATFGTGSILGLPYRATVGGFIRGRLNEDTADAGTYTVPERVASTTTTNDVRGTYTPAGALNGANVYTVVMCVQNGPNDSDGYGIAQA